MDLLQQLLQFLGDIIVFYIIHVTMPLRMENICLQIGQSYIHNFELQVSFHNLRYDHAVIDPMNRAIAYRVFRGANFKVVSFMKYAFYISVCVG